MPFSPARLLTALVVITPFVASSALAEDWPHWRGPEHDGVWREEGIVAALPEGELDYTWRVPCHLGYAGPAVADGKVYLFEYERSDGDITDNPGARDKLQGVERLRCLSSATGEELWKYEYERDYFISYPSGPRCTPTVDGDHVYLLGPEGDLTCLKTADGSFVWKKSFPNDYNAPTPMWGHSAHPLVDGDTLYCLVGGEGSVVVAFDKLTGEERWRALSTPRMNNEVGYCPPSIAVIGGQRVLVVFHPEAVCGLTLDGGEQLWSVPIKPAYGMSIAQPNVVGDRIFTTGYGGPSVFFRPPAGAGEAEVLWSGAPKTSVSAANPTPTADATAEVLYGVDANSSSLAAVDLATGERLWQTRKPTLNIEGRTRARHGTVFPVRQGDTDRFWLASETGDLILARLTPEAYEELGRKPLLEPTGDAFGRPVWWSHPAFAEKSIFARNDKELVRVNLAAE
ncbi:outer membrane biogenesis protein BamB [Planctomycetes bacterium MalM25]|nr:outer membrane biogenesis protein BamB [Planctomycetes bacterium MalM25]